MNFHINKILSILPLLLIIVNINITRVHAQSTTEPEAKLDYSGVTVAPPTFELNANPGNELENTIKVTNTSDKTLQLDVDVRNFTAVGEEGAVSLEEDAGNFALSSWVEVEPKSNFIDPKETKLFKFKIKVPVDAEPGGHFGSVVFRTGAQKDVATTGASVAQEIASLVLLRIAGDIKEEADIVSFNTDKNFYEYSPIEFTTRVTNNGNVHLRPTGFISITNIFGKQVAKVDINSKNVLPKAIRKYEDKWIERYLFGRYTATAVLSYSNGSKTLSKTTNFYVVPYKIAVAVIGSIIVLMLIILRIKKRLSLALRILMGKTDLQ